MEAYLDNSATTRCYEEVRDIVVKTMMEDYGNPSSMHLKGVETEQYLKRSAAIIAKTMKVQDKEIYFTSGGTESNNWALYGTAQANKRKGMHIITTQIEHAAISAPLAALEEQGFTVTRLGVGPDGCISLEELEAAITDETILVSVMYVNNEIGTVEPIQKIGELIKKKNPNTLFHVDAIQAYGKFHIYPKRMKIDLLSASGHKIHGPKGIGFLYVGDKVKIHPMILGGGQQKGMRSGTDNVPGVAGLGVAAEIMYKNLDHNLEQMRKVKHHLIEGLSKIEDVIIHGPSEEEGAPYILNASFMGIRSEVLLHTLEDRNIFVSAGSACSSHKRAGSATLTAIGCSKPEMEAAVRFSFAETTTIEEIDYTLQVLSEVVPALRKYTRR